MDVICGNITVQHELTALVEASRTTSSTGMLSSINKEMFQHVAIKVYRRSAGVREMHDINDVFFSDISDM